VFDLSAITRGEHCDDDDDEDGADGDNEGEEEEDNYDDDSAEDGDDDDEDVEDDDDDDDDDESSSPAAVMTGTVPREDSFDAVRRLGEQLLSHGFALIKIPEPRRSQAIR
jgi:hypothetical protein